MKPEKFEHTAIMVGDLDQSIRFYTDVLGFALRDRFPFNSVELGFVRLGDFEIELVAGEPSPVRGDAQLNHLAFSVANLESAVASACEVDPTLSFENPRTLWNGCRCVFFRGPDGERLEFFERPGGER